jgi:radical SAM protein with 4Fe4S-binding SPASM domain
MPLLELAGQPEQVRPGLPIHRVRHGDLWVYYTPGRLVVCNSMESQYLEAGLCGRPSPPWAREMAAGFAAAASATTAHWRSWGDREFAPEALTLHLAGACNLSCGYCPTGASSVPSAVLDVAVLRAAARTVARSCAENGKSLTVAFHGGGEPTLHRARLAAAVEATRGEAKEAGVKWRGYLATNGTFESGNAAWLADNFDQISVSCDGPPYLQDAQRPFRDATPSSAIVERNTRLLLEAGANVAVRATVTRDGLGRQSELVAYLNQRLGITRIRLEPVYRTGKEGLGLVAADAGEFVFSFLEAQQTGERCGCAVTTSCVRLDEIHGPYCDVLRDTVLIASDGAAYACAFRMGLEPLGALGPVGNFHLRWDRLRETRRRAAAIPAGCAPCINAYHCARGCPDVCCLATPLRPPQASFRCRAAQLLTSGWIRGAARSIQAEKADRAALGDDAALRRLAGGPFAGVGHEAEDKVDG